MTTSTQNAAPKCRTCIQPSANKFHDLTEQTDPERYPQRSLADLLWDVAKIDIKNEDVKKLPQKICGNCLRKLKNAYLFVMQAQRVNECLLASLHSETEESQAEEQSEGNHIDCLTEAPIDIPTANLEIKIETDYEADENMFDTLNMGAAPNEHEGSRKRKRCDDDDKPEEIIAAADVMKVETTPQGCSSQENVERDKSDNIKSYPITANEASWHMEEDHNFESIGSDGCGNNSESRDHYSARDAVKGNFSAQDRDYQHCEVMDKLNFMMQEIYKISMNVNTLLMSKHATVEIAQKFPLNDENELNELENMLNDDNCTPYINELKSIVRDKTVTKSLSAIFSEKLILQYNLEGKNKKLALNSYPKTLNVLFRGHEQYQTYGAFATDLRVALKRCKNRFHKAKQREKQSASETFLTPDTPERLTF